MSRKCMTALIAILSHAQVEPDTEITAGLQLAQAPRSGYCARDRVGLIFWVLWA